MNFLIQITPYLHLLAACIGIALGIFVFIHNKKSLINFLFMWTCLSASIWYIFFSVAQLDDKSRVILWTQISYLGVAFVPIACAHIHAKLLNIKNRFLRINYCLGYTIGSLGLILTIMNLRVFQPGFYQFSWGVYAKADIAYNLMPLNCIWVIGLTDIFAMRKFLRIKNAGGPNDDYQRAKYIILGLAAFNLASVDYIPKYGIDLYPAGFIFFIIWANLMAYAIVRHKLIDINIVIRKGLIYSILAAIITALFFSVFLLVEKIFQGIFGYQSMIITAIAGFVMALIFIPLRNKIQYFIDRIFYKRSPEEIEQENIKLKAELERTERLRSLGTLAAGMAHEIKNPLTSIKTFTEYLPKEYDKSEFREKFNRIVSSEVDRIDNIVKNILNFSKPRDLKKEDIDLQQLLDETLELLNNEILKHKIEVVKNYQLNGELFNGDYNQLKQAFLNIILNAIDAMPRGGELKIELSTDNSSLITVISDTGNGIEKDNLKHIFDPFYTNKDQGTGLGLSVVHGIIQRHKGKIEAESEVGQGTKFIVTLNAVSN